jgi:hypothetical protein
MARTAAGHFRDRASADAAYDELVAKGFSRDDISIAGRGREGGGLADDEGHVTAGEGAKVGGIAGLLIGAAAMLIPGIGPIVAVGPLAAGLAGLITGGVTGAVVGGITGGLVDAGLSKDEAEYYNERFQQGGYLLTVRSDDARYNDARLVLQQHGADMHGAGATTSGVVTEPRTIPGPVTRATEQEVVRDTHDRPTL